VQCSPGDRDRELANHPEYHFTGDVSIQQSRDQGERQPADMPEQHWIGREYRLWGLSRRIDASQRNLHRTSALARFDQSSRVLLTMVDIG